MSIEKTRAGSHVPFARAGGIQIGPWKVDETLTLSLTISTKTVANIAATANNPVLKAPYKTWTEYWSVSDPETLAQLSPGAELILSIKSSQYTNAQLDTFFGSNLPVYWTEVSPPWKADSKYPLPDGVTPYLFATQDPDSPEHKMGLILLVRDGKVAGASWHKTFQPKDGWNWQSPPSPDPICTFIGKTTDTSPISTSWYVLQTLG